MGIEQGTIHFQQAPQPPIKPVTFRGQSIEEVRTFLAEQPATAAEERIAELTGKSEQK